MQSRLGVLVEPLMLLNYPYDANRTIHDGSSSVWMISIGEIGCLSEKWHLRKFAMNFSGTYIVSRAAGVAHSRLTGRVTYAAGVAEAV
jgi:hypothetical protein